MQLTNNIQPETLFVFPLTRKEIESLLGLIDLGVKAGGLPVAKAAVQLNEKIQAAKPVDDVTSNE